MKCKSCTHAKKGYFSSAPNEYVCIGVKEPFVIRDIDVECTEYPEYNEDSTVTVKTSAILPSSIGTPCLICGDSVTVNDYRQGHKVCDKCKDAVMSLRRLLEYLEEETNEDT